jgi:hypothetical protein
MKRTLGWIVTWLAAVGLLLSFALAAHRGDYSQGTRVKRSAAQSRELSSCRILPARFRGWIPSRAGPHKCFPVPDVFLMIVDNDVVATGPPWLDYRGPPGRLSGALPELYGCRSSRQPKERPKAHSRPEFTCPLTVKIRKAGFATGFS